jgi:hypothetical protein
VGDTSAMAGPRSASTLGVLRRHVRTTPGHLQLTIGLIAVTAGMLGAIGTGVAVVAEATIGSIQTETIPSITEAETIRGTLSDADRSEANAFLAGGAEAPGPRQRYQRDLDAVTRELARAASHSAGDPEAVAQVESVNAAVATYAQLVEQARAANRQNYPIGAAYLRQASALVHEPGTGILAGAEALAALDDRHLAREDLTLALTGAALGVGGLVSVILLVIVVHTQAYLRRRFRRRRSRPLLAATALLLSVSAVQGLAAMRTAHGLTTAEGSVYPRLIGLHLARAIGADADTNESLSLIAHGNGEAFDKAFAAETMRLADRPLTDEMIDDAGRGHVAFRGLLADEARGATTGAERAAAARALRAFRAVIAADAAIRGQVAQNQYERAAAIALGTGPDQLGAAFAELDAALGAGIEIVQAQFDGAMREARPWPVLPFAVSASAVLIVLLTVRGLRPRIEEYRA